MPEQDSITIADKRILLADDDEDQRRLVSLGARRLGYEVVEAENGLEALEILQSSGTPRLLVLDWVMPGLSGPELCRRIRSRENFPYVYVILLSVRDAIYDIHQGLSAGADDYLIKPCDPLELQARVEVGRRVISDSDRLAALINELTKANEVLGAFSRTLAHDLRGTITTIGGYTFLLQKERTFGSEAMEMIDLIAAANVRMRSMVEDVLVLETATRRPEQTSFDLEKVIFDAAADARDVKVIMGNLPNRMIGHRSSIARSFKNLFENASHYAKRPDREYVTVTVNVEETVDSWTFFVEDNGPGIPSDDRERIFKTFERGSTSFGRSGTGLGLSIVAACAQAHDGEVYVTNGKSGGALFVLTLKKSDVIEISTESSEPIATLERTSG